MTLSTYLEAHAAALAAHHEAVAEWEETRDAVGVLAVAEQQAWEKRERTLAHLVEVTLAI